MARRSSVPVKPPRPEVLAFLQAIKENPDDDAPRLVLADWLEERGDLRGEFVRLQCQRAQREREGVAVRPDRRETKLLEKHKAEWLGLLAEKGISTEFHGGLVTVAGPARKLLSKRVAAM